MTVLRRFLALLVSLALGAAAVLVIVETVGVRVDESPVLLPVDDWEQRLTTGDWSRWSADAWTIASAVTLAVGILLVLLQLIPHRKTTVDRQRSDGERQVRFGRHGLNDRLREITVDQDGVLAGKVKASKRKAKVTALVPGGVDRKEAERSVRSAVGAELDRLRLAKKPKLRVEAARSGDRVL